MPKMKIKGDAVKRFRKTADDLKHKHAFKSHILTKVATKCKHQLRGISMLNKPDVARVERSLCLC